MKPPHKQIIGPDLKVGHEKSQDLGKAAVGSSLQPAGSAALVREQDAANELYEAACCLMRYKEADQWHNLENAAHRFNAARQSRLNDEIMRQNTAGER